jgi:hypothetical protein
VSDAGSNKLSIENLKWTLEYMIEQAIYHLWRASGEEKHMAIAWKHEDEA